MTSSVRWRCSHGAMWRRSGRSWPRRRRLAGRGGVRVLPVAVPDSVVSRRPEPGRRDQATRPAVIVRNPCPKPAGRRGLSDVFREPRRPRLPSSMTGGSPRSLRLLVEQHQLVHELLDAVAGLRGELLDHRILHRCDIGGEFVRASRHRPGLAEQGRDHLRRRRIHLVHAVVGHDHECAAYRKGSRIRRGTALAREQQARAAGSVFPASPCSPIAVEGIAG